MYSRVVEVALVLKNKGLGMNDVVAVDVRRELGLPIWIYAIWMIGGVYMALGSRDPVDRKRRVLEISKARCVLVERVSDEVKEWYSEYMLLSVLAVSEEGGGRKMNTLSPLYGETAYLPTTSGSTGEPKVIQISHRALSKHFNCRQEGDWCYTVDDRELQSSAVSFDIHVFQNSGPFNVGACLVLVSEEMILNFSKLSSYLNQNKITIMVLVPSMWMALFRAEVGLPHSLRVILFSGEKMTNEIFDILSTKTNAEVLLVNMYGPAECTIDTTIKCVPRYSKLISIGYPLSSYRCHIAAPDGVIGELWIGGPCVMDKYLNAANPCVDGWYPTGDLCYRLKGEYFVVGRKDFQVKVRGQRI
jgi:non-ribosomal peptide synthetase component F